MTAPSPRRARLAARLRSVRAATFPSGLQFARHLGWPQSRVSKLETGMQFPSTEDVHAWVRAAGAGPEIEAELLELLAAARVEYSLARAARRRAAAQVRPQAQLDPLVTQVSRVAEYQPAVIPGVVQTTAYARELLAVSVGAGGGAAQIEDLVAERVRRQEILYQPDKRVQVIAGEAALRARPGSPETMAGQLDRLLSVTGLANVELGIVPFAAPMPVAPVCGFTLLDDDFVLVQTLRGEQRLDDKDDIAVYGAALRRLTEVALTGADAVTLIRTVMADLVPG